MRFFREAGCARLSKKSHSRIKQRPIILQGAMPQNLVSKVAHILQIDPASVFNQEWILSNALLKCFRVTICQETLAFVFLTQETDGRVGLLHLICTSIFLGAIAEKYEQTC
jgi:hypothetical protein